MDGNLLLLLRMGVLTHARAARRAAGVEVVCVPLVSKYGPMSLACAIARIFVCLRWAESYEEFEGGRK